MKRTKHILLTAVLLLCSLVASAQTKVEIDGIWYNLDEETLQAEVTGGDAKYSGSITIPATINHEGMQYSVTSVGKQAFYYCNNLATITIPKSVTSIGDEAFIGCRSLTSIIIPEGVTSIKSCTFYNCSSLNTITLPESVTSIGIGAFYNCSSLNTITIPESVTSIGREAFCGCTGELFVNCNIPSTSYYEHGAFYKSNFTKVTIGDKVTSIGDYAFRTCESLTSITIPESSQLTSIGSSAFSGCSSLTTITIPKGVTSIGSSAFVYCSSLTAINIPEGVTSIGSYAFESCSSLTTITIPENSQLTSIGSYAFAGCSLTTINIPKGVTSIGGWAFQNCHSLQNMYCYAQTAPITGSNVFNKSNIRNATLYVPISALNAYKSKAPWSSFGKFETFEITVENITLNQSTATLTEGEDLPLTATVRPDDATDMSISWSSSNPSVATVDNTGKVTAVAPGTATITATANDGSGVSASCEIVVNELIMGKCATPSISYANGQVLITCDTEEAKVITTIVKGDDETREEMKFAYIPTQAITAYATKEKYEDSDVATLTLCWIPCTENHEGEEETGILTIPAKPVLISTQGGIITLTGLAEATGVVVYDIAGQSLGATTANEGTATINTGLAAGSIAIVEIDGHSIKVVIK